MSAEVLCLRVMRLNRPVFVRQHCEPTELYLDDIAGCLTTADAGIRADLDGAPIHRLPIDNPSLSTSASTSEIMDKPICDIVRVKVGGPGELLSLPQSFGSTYLGETFSAHMNLQNESNEICYNVELKVALHNSIEWINLSTTGTLTGASIPALSTCSPEMASRPNNSTGSVDLHPGQSLNAVIHYELKELGAHTLRCTAAYSLSTQASSTVQSIAGTAKGVAHPDHTGLEPYTFHRLYRFNVIKPLDVKKKFSLVDLNGTVFMEAQVQNLTSCPIYLERVAFEPSPHLSVVELNIPDLRSQHPNKSLPSCLRPEDVRQFLFQLTPTASLLQLNTVKSIASDAFKPGVSPLRPTGPQLKSLVQQPPISAGRLDITWRETMGERGRLQTSSLKYEIPHTTDIQVRTTELPSTVVVEKPFEISIELFNRSANALELLLNLDTLGIAFADTNGSGGSPARNEAKNQVPPSFPVFPSSLPLMWTGKTTRKLGSLTPGQTMPVTLQLVPFSLGLQPISGLVIHELTMDRTYEFNDLGHVLVCPV